MHRKGFSRKAFCTLRKEYFIARARRRPHPSRRLLHDLPLVLARTVVGQITSRSPESSRKTIHRMVNRTPKTDIKIKTSCRGVKATGGFESKIICLCCLHINDIVLLFLNKPLGMVSVGTNTHFKYLRAAFLSADVMVAGAYF